MVGRSILLLIAICFFSCGVAKEISTPISISNTHDINIAIDNVYLDNLDQLHIVDRKGTLTRFTQNLKILYKYSDNTLGSIQHIDVNNPLKTLAYHRDYGIISYLDNTLALIRKANLQDWGYNDVTTIASSNDGNIWLYDPAKNQIIKINDTGKIKLSTNNLNDYRLEDLNPTKIVERNNKVFVYDQQYGIIIFDNLGQYLKVLPIKDIKNFQTDGKNIYIFQNNSIKIYTIRLLEESTIPLEPKDGIKNVLISPRSIYYIYADGVDRKFR